MIFASNEFGPYTGYLLYEAILADRLYVRSQKGITRKSIGEIVMAKFFCGNRNCDLIENRSMAVSLRIRKICRRRDGRRTNFFHKRLASLLLKLYYILASKN